MSEAISDIERKIVELDEEREEIEMAMADIRSQLDLHHVNKVWRQKAKAALRYKGVEHQSVIRELGQNKRNLKALQHQQHEANNPFPRVFMCAAKKVLPVEMYDAVLNAALASTGQMVLSEGVGG